MPVMAPAEGEILGNEHHQDRGGADEEVGPETGGPPVLLALEADNAAQKGAEKKAQNDFTVGSHHEDYSRRANLSPFRRRATGSG
jgi:hypothetical protein